MIVTSFLANAVYALLLKNFPFVEFTSLRFVGGLGKTMIAQYNFKLLFLLGMLALNHYVAFQFFLTVWHPFAEVSQQKGFCMHLSFSFSLDTGLLYCMPMASAVHLFRISFSKRKRTANDGRENTW